jgi:hypothetical protein
MERRKFVVGLGALASGSAAAMGTGAFSSVTADRTATVSIADDSSAFLGLTVGNSELSEYVDESGNTISIKLAGENVQGGGVNPDAITKFDDLLQISNSGSQEVEVTISTGQEDPTLSDLSSYITIDDNNDNSFVDGVNIGQGNSKMVNVEFDLEGITNTYSNSDLTLVFTAEATDGS